MELTGKARQAEQGVWATHACVRFVRGRPPHPYPPRGVGEVRFSTAEDPPGYGSKGAIKRVVTEQTIWLNI